MFHPMKGKKDVPKTISPREFAALHQVGYTTVLFWLKNEMLDGAEKEPLPFGKDKFVYRIPADAPKPELKPGPKPKADQMNTSDQAGMAAAPRAEAPADEPAPAKAKRKVAKKVNVKKSSKKSSK